MPSQAARVMRSKERRRPKEAPGAPPERPLQRREAQAEPGANDQQGSRAAYGGESEHAVFLVPGLLGFENFSSFRYFGDRVVSALRSGLEARLGSRVPVVSLPIPPTASIADRQRHLVRSLADRLHRLEHGYKPLQVHLVGHSTGGLDANLLTHARPRGASSWSELDPRAGVVRDRIRSVMSIASPLQGACIARDPVARLLGERDLRGLPGLLGLLGLFAVSAIKDVEVGDFAASSLHELRKTARFVAEVSRRWALLSDLEPSKTIDLAGLKKDVVRRSFVTITGRARLGDASVTPPDSFFRALSERAEGWKTGCAEEGERVLESVARLKQVLSAANDNSLVLHASGVELPELLDAGHNDGVVNSARQLLDPSDPKEIAAIVVADHFDVVGYYDRSIWKSDEPGVLGEREVPVLAGLLHSGCNFRDDQLFELYHRVADEIACAAQVP